jgi:polysaccharide deacetylase 2 family uncharacterized protein YibQ
VLRPLLLIWLACTGPVALAGQLAIIIDDVGYNAELGRRLINLKGNFTLAVLPFTPHGKELAELAHKRGKELMLHAPMSNASGLRIEPGGLASEMTRTEYQTNLRKMLADVPYIQGLNNHMGSRLTREKAPMDWLMAELSQRQLYFIDSRTTAETVALQTAHEHQVPGMKRDVFLDNLRDEKLIVSQLHKVLALAKAQGKAIAIGHPYPETIAALEHIQPILDKYGVTLVSVSQLLDTDSAHLINQSNHLCPAPPLLLWRQIQHNDFAWANPPLWEIGYE